MRVVEKERKNDMLLNFKFSHMESLIWNFALLDESKWHTLPNHSDRRVSIYA